MSMQMYTVGLRSRKATVPINLSRNASIFSQVQPSSSVVEVRDTSRSGKTQRGTSHELASSLAVWLWFFSW